MDALGLQPIITATPILPAPVQANAPVIAVPDSSTPLPPIGQGVADGQDFNAAAAEQKRFEAVQRAAQDIANVYVVSDKTFSIFKDVTGKYITRFTSLRDGKVTYIPEPTLFKQAGSSASEVQPLLKINA